MLEQVSKGYLLYYMWDLAKDFVAFVLFLNPYQRNHVKVLKFGESLYLDKKKEKK